MTIGSTSHQQSTRDGIIVSNAVINAADFLGLKGADTANLLAISQSTYTRMKSGKFVLDENSKSFELATMFIRMYRSLYSFGAGDQDFCKRWLLAENRALAGQPVELIKKIEGFVDVIRYLDTARAKI
jgi:hypothetical protein